MSGSESVNAAANGAADPGAGPAGLAGPVGVVGTGTMGQGIAQVAVVAGHEVLLYDAVPGRARAAVEAIDGRLARLVEKGRLAAGAREAARKALRAVTDLTELRSAVLVIEAVAERLDVKRGLFAELEGIVADDCVLATNTSSLSVTAVGGGLRRPERLAGLHFFNPAPLLPLVEVVSGHATDHGVTDSLVRTAAAWGKTPVRCTDTPGFIVNRIARPFYAEAFRLLEERAADPATIDAVLRESGGFRMGPFELTDLIGQDVNEAVTRSVWEAFFQDPKFTPSLAQRRLVEAGLHGRKSGRGWFRYAAAAGGSAERPVPHTAEPVAPPEWVSFTDGPPQVRALVGLIEAAGIPVRRSGAGRYGVLSLPGGVGLFLADGSLAADHGRGAVQFDLALDYGTATRIAIAASADEDPAVAAGAAGLFQALGKQVSVVRDTPGMIVARTVAMLVDFAADAADKGVASPADIDTAMRLGVNYPLGPVEWGRRLGTDWVREVLARLHDRHPTGRYAPSLGLSRPHAAPGGVLSS